MDYFRAADYGYYTAEQQYQQQQQQYQHQHQQYQQQQQQIWNNNNNDPVAKKPTNGVYLRERVIIIACVCAWRLSVERGGFSDFRSNHQAVGEIGRSKKSE